MGHASLTDRMVDLVTWTARSLVRKPGRMIAVAGGSAVGALVLIVAVGVGQSSEARIASRFDALRATSVGVFHEPADHQGYEGIEARLPADGLERLRGLGGVEHAGRYSVAPQQRVVARSPFADAILGEATADVIGVGTDFWPAIGAEITGRPTPVVGEPLPGVVMSPAMLTRLGLDDQDGTVLLGGRSHQVAAVIEDAGSFPQANLAVFVVEDLFDEVYRGTDGVGSGVAVDVASGAAPGVAEVAAVALRPDRPEALRVTAADDPARLRGKVEGDLGSFALTAAGVGLLAATFGIANVLLVSTMHRRSEFGLRRALGTTVSGVVALVLLEAFLTGLLGSVVGAAVAMGTVVAWAEAQGWVPVLDGGTVALGVLVGVGAAMAGSLVPAAMAARVQPAEALRAR